jgi:hypothetical protein
MCSPLADPYISLRQGIWYRYIRLVLGGRRWLMALENHPAVCAERGVRERGKNAKVILGSGWNGTHVEDPTFFGGPALEILNFFFL